MNFSDKKLKPALYAIKSVLTAGILAAGIILLWRFEYLSQIACIDNAVGLIPIALVLCGSGAGIALLWIKHEKRLIAIIICLAVTTVLCFSLFPNALKCNWWIRANNPTTSDAEPDLAEYTPFAQNNLLAMPNGENPYTLTDDLPQLDGAIALYPVYAAFAQAFYSQDAFVAEGGCATDTYVSNGERVIMTNTLRAYAGLINGERDIIFVAGASESQKAAAKKAGVELVFTPIGKEAFVFLAPKTNPVDNLTYRQIKNIYSGKTAYWRTLGYTDGGRIAVFRRPDGSGSETGLQNIMKDIPLAVPQPLPDRSLAGSNSLMTQMTATYNGTQPALGYSYKYFATKMYKNDGVKLLSVNGVYPSAENINTDTYPFTVKFYAVTRGAPTGNVKTLIDFILSDVGQEIIEKTGYARI